MPDLFSPISIGSLTLKNRVMMAPMENGMAHTGGMVSERLIHFFEERARHGVGIIMTGSVTIAPEGAGLPAQIAIYDEKFLPGLKALCDAVHKAGAKIGAQIYHAGRQATEAITGLTPVAASVIPCAILGNHPRELAKEELPGLVEKFAVAADRAVRAGFDLIEVHFAHGYLLAGFLSPHSNHRKDEYGGSLENRCRFPLEVLKEVVRVVDGRVPVTIRISAQEFLDDGLQFEDVKAICRRAEECGAQAVSVTAGCYDSVYTSIQPMYVPRGFLIPYAEELKKTLSVPVIVAGRLNSGTLIKEIVSDGKADMVAVGRGFFADPELVEKLQSGAFDDIRYCVACNQGCCDRIFVGEAATCMLNARASFEMERNIVPASSPKKIAVVGGGPAGMEAARVAALRGHQVVVYEQEALPGGKLPLVAAPPEKGDFLLFLDYLRHQLVRLGVPVVRRRVEKPEDLQDDSPDAIVIATGARQVMVPVPGHDLPLVVMAEDILSGKASFGQKIVVVGGGLVGVETAHFLASLGAHVVIVEMLDGIAREAGPTYVQHIHDTMKKYHIDIYTNTRIERILRDGIEFQGKKEPADTVVIAAGYRSNNAIVDVMRKQYSDVYVIGDARSPKNIFQAVHDAFLCAEKL